MEQKYIHIRLHRQMSARSKAVRSLTWRLSLMFWILCLSGICIVLYG